MTHRQVVIVDTLPTNGVIKSDLPVSLYGLAGKHINELSIQLGKREAGTNHTHALSDDRCAGLVIDKLIIRGNPDQSSKESWMKTDQMGALINSPNVKIKYIYAEMVHVPIKFRSESGVISELVSFNTSGDGFQLCADGATLKKALINGLLEVYPYRLEHQDVGMIFPVAGRSVIKDVLVNQVQLRRTGHKWENKSPQGILAPDKTSINCHVTNCELPGVHPEHGVRFGHARNCLVKKVKTNGVIGFGDRKTSLIGSNNNAVDCDAPTIDYEDGSGPFLESIAVKQNEEQQMKMSKYGVQVLMQSEGFCRDVYIDSAGLPTVGVGHCLTQSEVNSGKILLGDKSIIDLRLGPISNDDVMKLLESDLVPRESAVCRLISVPLEQHQFDAILHWLFNVGEEAVRKSSLRKKLNQGNFSCVPDELRKWNKATVAGAKEVIPGLVNRRETEVSLWLGDYKSERDTLELPLINNGKSPMHGYNPSEHGAGIEALLRQYQEKMQQVESRMETRVDDLDQLIQRQNGRENSGFYKEMADEAYRSARSDVFAENTKPRYQSKILAFVVGTGITYLGAKFGFDLPAELSSTIETVIVTGGLAAIGAARAWFTTKVLG